MKNPLPTRIRRALLYSVVSTAATLLFTYLTFPWNAVRDRLETMLSSSLRGPDRSTFQVTIGELRPSWFTGLRFERLVIVSRDPAAPPDAPPATLIVPELTVRIELWPLVRRRPTVDFHARLVSGEVSGQVRLGKKEQGLALSIGRLDLNKSHDLFAVAGRFAGMDLGAMELAGALTGRADLAFKGGDFATLDGNVLAGLDHATLEGGRFGEYDLPKVALGKVDLQILAGRGKVDVRRIAMEGGDVDLHGDGVSLTLNRNFAFSMLHGQIKVHFGPDLLKRVPYLGLGLSALKPPDHNGTYTLPLGGTLRNPRLM